MYFAFGFWHLLSVYSVKHFVSVSSVTFWHLYSTHAFHQGLGSFPSLPEAVRVLALGIQTRHSLSIRLPVHLNRQSDFSAARYNTVTYGMHSLRHLGPNLWGKLSADLREVTTLKCFKNKIRTLDIVALMDNRCKCCHLCNS